MDEEWRKKYPSLPENYVTIDMLRERWLKKQEEEKLNEKQEHEALQENQNLEINCENQSRGQLGDCHWSENNGPGKRVGNDGGEMAVIEEKGKGKEKMGWSGKGRLTNKKYYRSRNEKHGADWKRGNGDISKVIMEDVEKSRNPRTKEGLDLVEKKNGPKGVKIILKNKEKLGIKSFPSGESSGTQGIGKIMSGVMTGVLPKNDVREENPQISVAKDVRREGFRGGFHRNENDQDEGFSGKEHRVELKELEGNESLGKKMEDEVLQVDRKGNGRKWRNRTSKGDKFKQMEDEVLQIDRKGNGRKWRNRTSEGDKFKQSGAEERGLKLNDVDLMPADEISEIGNERDRMKGMHSSTGSNDIKQNRVDEEALAADTPVLENKVLVEKSRNGRFRGYGGMTKNLTIDDRKGRNLGSKVERKFRSNNQHMNYERLEVNQRMKQRSYSMVWVKKEQSGAVGGEASSTGVPSDE